MPRSRRIQSPLSVSDFERRSVQLIAACALGLAGMASVQMAPASARQASALSSPARQGEAPRPVRLDQEPAAVPFLKR